MSDYNFGDWVYVDYVVQPVYLKLQTSVSVPVPSGRGPFMVTEEREIEPRLVKADRQGLDYLVDEDIGLPLPSTARSGPEPKPGQVYRRLRRFPAGNRGIIVGRTHRQEGVYFPGRKPSSYFGDEDYEPAQLEQTRTVKVYQVAMGSLWPDGYPYPAEIVLALPYDLEGDE